MQLISDTDEGNDLLPHITATTTLLQTKIRRQHKNLDSRYKCINTCTEIKKIFWGFRKSQVAVNISHEQLCGLLLCPAELHLPRSTGKIQGAEALWHAGGTRVDVGNHQDLTRGGGLNSEKNRGAHTRQQWRMATIAVDKKTFFSLPEYEWEMTGTKKISFLHYALHFRGGGLPFRGCQFSIRRISLISKTKQPLLNPAWEVYSFREDQNSATLCPIASRRRHMWGN